MSDMKEDENPIEDDDEMRPEYDFSKLKFVGRGIYAERFRRGTNLAELLERDENMQLDDDGDQEMNGKAD